MESPPYCADTVGSLLPFFASVTGGAELPLAKEMHKFKRRSECFAVWAVLAVGGGFGGNAAGYIGRVLVHLLGTRGIRRGVQASTFV